MFWPQHFWTNEPVLYRVASIIAGMGTHNYIAIVELVFIAISPQKQLESE